MHNECFFKMENYFVEIYDAQWELEEREDERKEKRAESLQPRATQTSIKLVREWERRDESYINIIADNIYSQLLYTLVIKLTIWHGNNI
jgi:hypothetical protein